MQDYVTNYEEAVEFLYRIPRFNSNHSLKDIQQFLTLMGSPEQDMKIVHVAGTNGKGSTSVYLATLLQTAGLKVGLFTSPHLVDIRERFQINGKYIAKALLAEAVQKVVSIGKQFPEYTPCFFDMMFFVGMYAFSKEKVDILILETGLGGRLDATNAVSQKNLSLIAHIGMDHTELLGNTLEEIAMEKAGIMMPKVPTIIGLRNDRVARVFLKKADEIDSPCRILEKDVYTCHGVCEKSVAFSYQSRYYGTIHITLSTTALYQVENASLALAGMEDLIDAGVLKADSISVEMIQKALLGAIWPGRMEEIAPNAYLDGAHNLDGIGAFLNTVSHMPCEGGRILIFSAVSDKDYAEMLAKIAASHLFDHILVTQVQGERAVDADILYQELLDAKPIANTMCMPKLEDALQYAFTKRQQLDDIYIVGSLYLVGQTKRLLGNHLEFSAKEEGELV